MRSHDGLNYEIIGDISKRECPKCQSTKIERDEHNDYDDEGQIEDVHNENYCEGCHHHWRSEINTDYQCVD